MEDYARILDYLPQGHPDRSKYMREPLAYALGEDEFKLFELTPKENAGITVGDRVYIGKDIEKRDVIVHVKRRVGYDELTTAAQNELPFVIGQTVKDKEEKFIRLFNEAQAITTRFHMLELLPGLGKKGPFKNFEDLAKRVPTLRHPDKIIAKRIEMEIANPGEKYHLFVAR